jgi:hypothetical protein
MADLGNPSFDIRASVEPPSRRQIIEVIRIKLLGSFEWGSERVGFLSTERQIAEDFTDDNGAIRVSRVPIREALTILRALGVLVVDPVKRQYRASIVPLAEEGGDDTFRILESELLGDIRTALDFAAQRFRRPDKADSEPRAAIEELIDRFQSTEWADLEPAQGIIHINNLIADAVRAFGLGRTAESLRSHLDILEFSAAAARRDRLEEQGGERLPVLDPELIHVRSSVLGKIFKAWLDEDPDDSKFVDRNVDRFSHYVNCLRDKALYPQEAVAEKRPAFPVFLANFVRAARG